MSYGIEQEEYINLMKERFNDAELDSEHDFDSEIEQIADLRMAYDEDKFPVTPELIEIDTNIIKQAKALGKFINDDRHYDKSMKEFWAWNPDKIAKGEFPFDMIPDHVKELAKSLYYNS
jgi:hypothetical protein